MAAHTRTPSIRRAWAHLAAAVLLAASPLVQAEAEANAADVAQLDALKGVGLKRAAVIVDERRAHGPYKDWIDLIDRVKGIGTQSALRLSSQGLRVNGRPYDGAPAPLPATPASSGR